jgi:hypothetical protein
MRVAMQVSFARGADSPPVPHSGQSPTALGTIRSTAAGGLPRECGAFASTEDRGGVSSRGFL